MTILTVKNGKVVINVNVLVIPSLAKCKEYYEKKGGEELVLKVFEYLYCMYDPESPYQLLVEEARETKIKVDKRGDYNPDLDEPLIKAAETLKELYETPIARLFRAVKVSLDKVSVFLGTEEVETGKDGSSSEIRAWHKELPTIVRNYKAVEAEFTQESAKARGNTKYGIDELDNNDSDFR